jgi:hypothetical protein
MNSCEPATLKLLIRGSGGSFGILRSECEAMSPGGVVSGYVLADVKWASEDARRAYVDLLGPSLDAHGGVAIAGSPDARVLEGTGTPMASWC